MIKTKLSKKISLTFKYPKTALNTINDLLNPQKTVSFPHLINCFITEKCNFNCPMCHVAKSRLKNSSQLSFIDIKKIADQGSKHGISIQLSGGEPLLHPEIIKIIKYLHQKKIVTGLVTNGLLLEKYAQDIIKSGLDFIAISLDGPDEATQYQRGFVKNSFSKINKGIQTLVKLRGSKSFPNIRLATVINKNNLHNFEKIYSLAQKLKVDQWSLSHYFYYFDQIKKSQNKFFKKYHTGNDVWGQYIGSNKQFLNTNEISILENKLKKLRNKKNHKLIVSLPPKINLQKYYQGDYPSQASICTSPFKQIFIRGNGDVEMCHGFIIGNIKKQNLQKIWQNSKAQNFRKIFKRLKQIPACFRCCALDIKFDND